MKLTKVEKKEEGSKRILSVEVPVEEVAKQREIALVEVQKHVHIQGFRAGKAPRELVEKEYRREIDQETVQHVVQEAYHQALEQHSIDPIAQGKISDVVFEAGRPVTFNVTLEVRPDIVLPDYAGLSGKKPIVTVTDQDIEMVIDALRHQRAEYVAINDRGVKEGDVVTVDLKGMIDLKMLPNLSETNASFTIGSKSFDQLEQALVGSKTTEEKRAVVQIPADHPDESIRGRDVTFYATIKEIKEPKLPAIDEEFIKTVSSAENVEALKKQIRDQLNYEREKASRDVLKRGLLEQMVKTATFDPPDSMIQSEFDHMVQELGHQLEKRGTSLEKLPVPEQLEIKQQYWKIAQSRVKGSMILEEVAKKEALVPSGETVDQLVQNIQQAPQVDEKLREHVKTSRGRAQLQYDVAIEKAFDFLIQKAKVVEVDPAELQEAGSSLRSDFGGGGHPD